MVGGFVLDYWLNETPQKTTEESFIISINPGIFFSAGTTIFLKFCSRLFQSLPSGGFLSLTEVFLPLVEQFKLY